MYNSIASNKALIRFEVLLSYINNLTSVIFYTELNGFKYEKRIKYFYLGEAPPSNVV